MKLPDSPMSPMPAAGPSRECSESWLADRDAQAAHWVTELERDLSAGAALVVVDEGYLDLARLAVGRTIHRLDYGAHGPPTETAVLRQYQQHRQAGADLVLVAWPALGWLDRYPAWNALLVTGAERVRVGDGYVLFDLRPGVRAEEVREQANREAALRQENERLQTQFERLQTQLAATIQRHQTETARESARHTAKEIADQESRGQWVRKCADLQERCRQLEAALGHQKWLVRVSRTIRTQVPLTARLAIATGGDDAMLGLSPQPGWHFPQMPDGAHGGKPSDGLQLVAQIDEVRSLGATHLLLPAWLDWWFRSFPEFQCHLQSVGTQRWVDADVRLFELEVKAAAETSMRKEM